MPGIRDRLRPLWELLKVTTAEWWNDNTMRLAASLAFYTIFSLAPILVISIAIAGLIFGEEQAARGVVSQFEQLAGVEGGRAIGQVAAAGRNAGGGPLAIAIGVVTLVIGSTVVFAELQSALNQVWDVKADPEGGFFRSLVRDRMRAFAVVLGVGFLLVVSLLISAILAAASEYLNQQVAGMPVVWQGVNLVASFVVVTLLFAMIYKYLPDVKITWRDVAIGAVVTALLFTLGKFLIGMYLGQMAIGSTYGAAGSFVVLLVWIYYSALICFFGAEFTQVFARRYGSRIRPKPHAVRVGMKSDQV